MSDGIQSGISGSGGTGATGSTRGATGSTRGATAGGTGLTNSDATVEVTSTTPEVLSQNPDAINAEILNQELQAITNDNGDLEAYRFGEIYSSLQGNGTFSPSKALAILVYFLSNTSMVLTDETISSQVQQADNNREDLNPDGNNLLGLLQSQLKLSMRRINPETLNKIKKVKNPIVFALNCIPLINNDNKNLDVEIDEFVAFLNYLKTVINDNETSAGS